jgi:hypothetical protein
VGAAKASRRRRGAAA